MEPVLLIVIAGLLVVVGVILARAGSGPLGGACLIIGLILAAAMLLGGGDGKPIINMGAAQHLPGPEENRGPTLGEVVRTAEEMEPIQVENAQGLAEAERTLSQARVNDAQANLIDAQAAAVPMIVAAEATKTVAEGAQAMAQADKALAEADQVRTQTRIEADRADVPPVERVPPLPEPMRPESSPLPIKDDEGWFSRLSALQQLSLVALGALAVVILGLLVCSRRRQGG